MMLAYVKSNMYIDFNKENNMEDPQFYVANQVKISKYKKNFANGHTPNWSEEVFAIKNAAKILCREHCH